jgi:hypothetical protein
MDNTLRETLLEVIENSLEAQLRSVRRLRSPVPSARKTASGVEEAEHEGMSQLDMVYDILSSGQALHITAILAAIHERFQIKVDRESIVSALSKRVARGDRFQRVGRNTFSLLTPPSP